MRYQNKNEDYFTTANKNSSYWAGFISADGCLLEKKSTLQITIAEKDKRHLEILKKELNRDYTIKTAYKTGGYADGFYCSFAFTSEKTIQNLKENFLLHARKTHTLRFPRHLSLENKRSYICGYIDGDGCISTTKPRNKLQLSICGNKEFLEEIRSFLAGEGSIRIVNNIYSSRNIYVFAVGGKKAIEVLDFLYDDELPLMRRKWDKYRNNKERKFGQYLKWSKEEEQVLKQKYIQDRDSSVKIHQECFPDRSFASVEKKISQLGLKKRPQPERKWVKEEDEKMWKAMKKGLTTKQIYEIILPYRTFSSVKNRRRKLYNEKKGK